MGRVKQKMDLISNEKNRYITYQKRKKGLMKKTYELNALCDVQVCLIIYGPEMKDRPADTAVWPQNQDAVRHLIDAYKNQSSEDRARRTHNISNFFEDRGQKMEEAVAKLRNKNDESRFATWDERYNCMSKEQLQGFEAMLEEKIQFVKSRMALLRSAHNHKLAASAGNINNIDSTFQIQNQSWLLGAANMQLEAVPVHDQAMMEMPIHYSLNQTQQQVNPLAMMNDNYYFNNCNYQVGSVLPSSGNLLCNIPDFERPSNSYYDPMTAAMYGNGNGNGMPENNHVMGNNIISPPAPMGYYMNQDMETMSPYMQYLKMAARAGAGGGGTGTPSSSMQVSQMDNEFFKGLEYEADKLFLDSEGKFGDGI